MEIVECYSGSAYAESPRAFTWQGERLEVQRLLEQRRTPQGKFFRVQASGEQVFELTYLEAEDQWWIVQP